MAELYPTCIGVHVSILWRAISAAPSKSRSPPLASMASQQLQQSSPAPSKEESFKVLSQFERVTKIAYNTDDDVELLRPERRQTAEKQLIRKLDVRLLPTIILIFILNYIDVSYSHFSLNNQLKHFKRTAIASARLKGLEKDIHLTGDSDAIQECSTTHFVSQIYSMLRC